MAESERAYLVETHLPTWEVADLPEPRRLSWRHWTSFIGPGIVMMGIQIGGGEWLFGPEITARYGGGLMWIATVAIVLQVFYNLECGRYALYCGEPVFTGFMRMSPGPWFWVSLMLLLNVGALIPGLSTHGAAIITSLLLDRPPGEEDRWLVRGLAYACLLGVALPVLVGGKIYNMLQAVMTFKVLFVLGFCTAVGVLFVSPENWWNVFSGFARFGNVPIVDEHGGEQVVNALAYYQQHGAWPAVALANIAVLGAFAGYAGGGGLANSTYSNFVRDKGWGMGSLVGAIPSAIGGKSVQLSHVGKVFPIDAENLRRWSGWWRYILTDQLIVWAPGCFMGMALPALVSIEFAQHSPLYHSAQKLEWSQAVISADGLRHAPYLGAWSAQLLWLVALVAGMAVMLPSQMSIVDDFSRRWTDAIWSANSRVRGKLRADQVKWIYYAILGAYVLWSLVCVYFFTTPKLMTLVIANLNNVALGVTALQLIWINHRLLPPAVRPRWYHTTGVALCSLFYLGLALLVFIEKQLPLLRELWQ
ncbi:MAG: Nramp family divalent metal transporter [Pirellulales bacterium]|nr:Nramp family divalent metal transporter [Pirellulales bacterium]